MNSSVKIDSFLKQRYYAQKVMFTLIKQLNLLQLAQLSNRIENSTYESKKKDLLKNYKNLEQTIPNFDLGKFIQQFGLQEQHFALQMLKDQNNNKQEDILQVVRFQSKLKEIEDDFFVNRDDMKVGYFKNNYIDLENIFQTLPKMYVQKLKEDFRVIQTEQIKKYK